MDSSIGEHIKDLWTCQLTAICLYKLNSCAPETHLNLLAKKEITQTALMHEQRDIAMIVHLQLDLLCIKVQQALFTCPSSELTKKFNLLFEAFTESLELLETLEELPYRHCDLSLSQ